MRFPMSLSRERIVFAAVVTIAPLLLCGFMFGFDIPLASAKFWSLPKNDMIAMTAAYEAFIRQPWTFPLTMVSGLLPKPVSIVFTDSIPWLAILLKASGLGRFFNPLGVFLMLSYPLQAWGMIALLRSLGVKDRVTLLIGAAFALLLPTWIARQFGHIALSGHWIVLLALALSVASAREGLTPRRIALFAGLAALATGIHAYHLVPIGAAFGAALLSELLQRRDRAWIRCAVAAAAVLATLGVCAALLGYGEGASKSAGAAGIGFYSMNVLGPVWPEASRLAGQAWNGSWYAHTLDPNGGQAFEGFQFMGFGALALVATLIGLAIRDRVAGRRPQAGFWARWAPLVVAMVFVSLWAIGWAVYVGPKLVATLPKPGGKVADMVSVFRAHGRFFWAPAYLLLALAIQAVRRLPGRVGLGVLVAALALQAYDTGNLRQGVRTVFAHPDTLDVPAGFVNDPAVRGRPWILHPTFFCSPSQLDLRAIGQVAMLAERGGGTTNTFGTARSNDAPCEIVPPEITVDAAPGDRRITVVMANDQATGGFLQPVSQRSDCYRFSRGAVCGRDLAGVKGLTPVARGELATAHAPIVAIHLDKPPKSPGLTSGWADLDPGGKAIWTVGKKALFELDVPADIKPSGFYVDIVAVGFSDQPLRPQHVTLSVEGRAVGTREVDPGDFRPYRFTVPAGAVQPGRTARFVLDLPDARASTVDPRVLGIGVQTIAIAQ